MKENIDKIDKFFVNFQNFATKYLYMDRANVVATGP